MYPREMWIISCNTGHLSGGRTTSAVFPVQWTWARKGLLRVDDITYDTYIQSSGYGGSEITGQDAVHRGAFSFALAFGFITATTASFSEMEALNEWRNYRKVELYRGYREPQRPWRTIPVFLVRIDT